jgi:hypothetical protein
VLLCSRAAVTLIGLATGALLYVEALSTQLDLELARDVWPQSEDRVTVPPPRVRALTGGFNEALADVAWAKTLVYYGGGMAQGSSLADVDPLLMLVNALDPHFRRPYVWGAYATTFRQGGLKPEEVAASIAVLERGVQAFPEDWELQWILGLRYYLDMKSDDPAKQREYKELGAQHIERAMRLPNAPADLATLAATLRTDLGQKERALKELREMILNTTDETARARLLDRYAALASEGTASALAAAGKEFEQEWKATAPYAPPAMFVLIGPPAPVLSPAELARPAVDLPTDEPDPAP